MPNIHQIRTVFTGLSGLPGYNQLYFDAAGDVQDHSDAVRAFWEAMTAVVPIGWKYTIDADVSVLDDSTGDLVSVLPTVPLVQSGPGGAASYTGGAGACVGWITNEVHFTKRLRGRTFVVPLLGLAYDSDGTIQSAALASIRAAAAALNAEPDFGVWGRPVDGLNGLFGLTVATNTRDKVAWLSSRRD